MGWATVVRVGGVGDNLIASSVLPGLRARYGRVEVISKAPAACVFENNPWIDKLSILPEDEPPTDALAWQERWAWRARESEYFLNLSHSCETALAFLRGQTQFWWPDAARRAAAAHSYLEYVHQLADVPMDKGPLFIPTTKELQQAHDTLTTIKAGRETPVVGWVLSGSRPDKLYPFAHLAIARIITELHVPVVMMGAPGRDFELAKSILEQVQVHAGGHDGLHLALSADAATPNWPIRRILTMAQSCDVVVTPDTGPAWAVATDDSVAKVLMLSHASEKNIAWSWKNTTVLHADPERVPCWPCHRLHDDLSTCRPAQGVQAASCMADISVQRVVAAVATGLPSREKNSGQYLGLRREVFA